MNPQQRLQYWQVFDNFRKSRESLYAPKIAKVLNQQKREFIEKYRQGLTSGFLLNSEPLKLIIRNLYFDAGINFGDKVRYFLKQQASQKRRMPMGFNQRMQELIEMYYGVDFLNMSEGITDTTRQLLVDVLTNAQRDGLGFDDTIALLEGTELSRNRARLIARTETITAANSGSMLSAKESGIVVNKVWIATQDARTRHDHYNVSADAIDIDAAFKVGQYEMEQPGARRQPNGLPVPAKEVCNCRCCVSFIAVRDASGRVLTN